MERNDPRYQAYVEILKEELIPAMGCTEPIALAYAAAKAREVLGVLPDSVQLQVSGSIIKNVKSVIVPNTGHLKGMEAAVAAGIIAGSAEKELEVISEVSEEKKSAIRDYLQTVPITIEHTEQGHVFDIVVTERCGQDYARVRIADYHTNICRIEKNGTVLYEVPLLDETVQEDARADRSLLNMQDIWDFAETADLRDVVDETIRLANIGVIGQDHVAGTEKSVRDAVQGGYTELVELPDDVVAELREIAITQVWEELAAKSERMARGIEIIKQQNRDYGRQVDY